MNWNVNLIVPINIISCLRKNTTYTVTAKKAGTTSFTISVKDEHGSKTYIWNDGEMPPDLNSTEKLFMKHSSKPCNPKLANIFFKSGMIEAWGRGFEKIKEACVLYDGTLPEYEINESGIMVLCKDCDRFLELLRNDGQHHDQNGHDMVMIYKL